MTTRTDSRSPSPPMPLANWPKRGSTYPVTWHNPSDVPEEESCSICYDENPLSGQAREGILKAGCCSTNESSKYFHLRCLEAWKKTQQAQTPSRMRLDEVSCPACTQTLDSRVFYRISEQDLLLSESLRRDIDQHNYEFLKTYLDYCKSGDGLPLPYTWHTTVRHAASIDALAPLVMLKRRDFLDPQGGEKIGFKEPVLYTAARFGSPKATRFLLKSGALADGNKHARPLHAALMAGHEDIVGMLTSNNCHFDRVSENGMNALSAIYTGIIKNLGRWGELKEDLEQRDALETRLVELYLEKSQVSHTTLPHPIHQGKFATALNLATLAGNLEAFTRILNASEDSLVFNSIAQECFRNPETRNGALFTGRVREKELNTDPPIFDALNALRSTSEKFELLLARMPNAEIVLSSFPQRTILLNETLAYELRQERKKPPNESLVTRLLKTARPVLFNLGLAYTSVDVTPSKFPLTRELLAKGHYPDFYDSKYNGPFHLLASAFVFDGDSTTSEHYQLLKFLLEKSHQVNAPLYSMECPGSLKTPLHHYALTHRGDYYSETTVKILGTCGATTGFYTAANAPDIDGNTPLHYAVKNYYNGLDNRKLIQDLLLIGADPTIKNKNGESPKEICRTSGREDILWLLYTRGSTMPSSSFRTITETLPSNSTTITTRCLETKDRDYQRRISDCVSHPYQEAKRLWHSKVRHSHSTLEQ